MNISDGFVRALKQDKICVHPTDTLMGFAFNPNSNTALELLKKIKKRSSTEKSFVSLVADASAAFKFWQPLPLDWQEKLERIWPAPLTVIWRASETAPTSLVMNGSIAIRVPVLASQWFSETLQKLPWPLPSTSINLSGERSVLRHEEYLETFGSNKEIFFESSWESFGSLPSTIIQVETDGSFQVVRQGSFDVSLIESSYS